MHFQWDWQYQVKHTEMSILENVCMACDFCREKQL